MTKGNTCEGKHYTEYEATQKQRQLECAQQVQKNRILVSRSTGDALREQTAQIRLQMLSQHYKAFSKAAGLPLQQERAWVAGFGPKQAKEASVVAKTIEENADLLYDTGSSQGNIRAWLRDKPIREKIRSEEFPLTIHQGRQNKHIEGMPEFQQYVKKLQEKGQFGPSRITITQEEIVKVVEEWRGRGILLCDKSGNWRNQERITCCPNKIGIAVNNLTGKEADTSVFIIHYSQSGIHIVPDYPNRKGMKATE